MSARAARTSSRREGQRYNANGTSIDRRRVRRALAGLPDRGQLGTPVRAQLDTGAPAWPGKARNPRRSAGFRFVSS